MDTKGPSPVFPIRLQPGPATTVATPADRQSLQPIGADPAADVQIDCDTCPVRGLQCDDCVVSAILGPPELLDLERQAIAVLVDRGLVPPLQDPRADAGGALTA